MTTPVNAKLESLIKTMSEGEEYARHGFGLLSKRPNPERYFDALSEAGFFDPSQNSGPVPTEPGFVQIPFWSALTYLEAIAKRAAELDNLELANKILTVVRNVSNYRDASGAIVDNHYTYWKFAEIFGVLPLRAITTDDLSLARNWLFSKFDRGMVGRTLGTVVLPRFLASAEASDIEKACILMKQCMAYEWPTDDKRGRDIVTAVENYWLKEIVNKNAKLLGAKAGVRGVKVFEEGLRNIFTDERRPYGSSLWRPAIEDNPQNTDFRGAENRFVEGMRDALMGWLDADGSTAASFVEACLEGTVEIIRRIALYMITERFTQLRTIFESVIEPKLFNSGLRHELYRLLSEHFSDLSENAKAAVITSLRALPLPEKGDDAQLRLKWTQREWLTAIKNYQPANDWFKELCEDPALGSPSDHPDFLSYHEMRHGPGPTPFGVESLTAFAQDGTIVDRLNEFKETDTWKGPTLGGLVEALQSAVVASPKSFLPLLSSFHSAKIPFQHALLSGFKRLFDARNEPKQDFEWSVAWPKLFAYFAECVNDQSFWSGPPEEENVNFIPTREWMISLISSFLEAGTRDDKTAYSPDLLPQGWALIEILLSRVPPDKEPSLKDAMTHALNTNKGRLLGAMFNHALRTCRVATQNGRTVAETWPTFKRAFDVEIEKCRDANFEFSTLSASYIANIDYMSREWLGANISRIFPLEYPNNFKAALGGLAYGTPSGVIYKMLAAAGVFEGAFREKLEDSHSMERVIEWISLAYLWGDETLDSPMLKRVFESEENLGIAARYFWSVRGEKLNDDQVERILSFWSSAIVWAKTQKVIPTSLLASVSRLSEYLKTLDARAKELLLAVVPYVHTGYGTDSMVEELDRFVDANPADTAEILLRMLEANAPNYDMDNKLKSLIWKLATRGHRSEAIKSAELLRKSLPGMIDFYKELVAAPAAN